MDHIHLPSGVGLLGIAFSFVIPGMGFYLRAPPKFGRLAAAACVFLLLVFFAELGRFAGNMALGLLLALHVSSLGYLLEPLLAGSRFRSRVLLTGALFTVLGLALYLPGLNYVDAHWFTPLRVKDRTVIVQKFTPASAIRRQDWIAYNVPQAGDHNAFISAGIGLRPVLALPGDSVRFARIGFQVNGTLFPALPHMPRSGEFVVPEKHWFVWPDFDITGHGNAAEGAIESSMLKVAVISQQEFTGKPFKHWFWHHQVRL